LLNNSGFVSVFICRFLNINAENAAITLSCLKKPLIRVRGDALLAAAKMLQNRFRYSALLSRKANRRNVTVAAISNVPIRDIRYG
jgi:hypothetical protein